MTLKVIGAGFGRNGTLSLKSALDELGLGPCYHMVETHAHPEHDAMWLALAKGEAADWRADTEGLRLDRRLADHVFLEGPRRGKPQREDHPHAARS